MQKKMTNISDIVHHLGLLKAECFLRKHLSPSSRQEEKQPSDRY